MNGSICLSLSKVLKLHGKGNDERLSVVRFIGRSLDWKLENLGSVTLPVILLSMGEYVCCDYKRNHGIELDLKNRHIDMDIECSGAG